MMIFVTSFPVGKHDKCCVGDQLDYINEDAAACAYVYINVKRPPILKDFTTICAFEASCIFIAEQMHLYWNVILNYR